MRRVYYALGQAQPLTLTIMNIDACTPDSKQLLSLNDALDKIFTTITPITESETLALSHTLRRVVHEDIYSPINLPLERNSAMDGYAFCSPDFNPKQLTRLNLVGTSWAGAPYQQALKQGECVRIFTGAVLPPNSDSIVIQEHVQVNNNLIELPLKLILFQHVREVGEDVRTGQKLLQAGKQLAPADIGLLAAVGITQIKVRRQLKIAFCSTGNELRPLGQILQSGAIYDSNRYMLNALLNETGFPAQDLGIIPDNPQKLRQTLESAAQQYDVIISTGGVSVGAADHVKDVLGLIGDIHLWKIAIKPGKPLAFGKINTCYFFGLPGNPAAVLTTFQQIVAAALEHLNGTQHSKPLRFLARCTETIKKTAGRAEFQRGILQQTTAGTFTVTPLTAQGSNIISTSSLANCYILLSAHNTGVATDEMVEVEPFRNRL